MLVTILIILLQFSKNMNYFSCLVTIYIMFTIRIKVYLFLVFSSPLNFSFRLLLKLVLLYNQYWLRYTKILLIYLFYIACLYPMFPFHSSFFVLKYILWKILQKGSMNNKLSEHVRKMFTHNFEWECGMVCNTKHKFHFLCHEDIAPLSSWSNVANEIYVSLSIQVNSWAFCFNGASSLFSLFFPFGTP
jgi:hypothetical protein